MLQICWYTTLAVVCLASAVWLGYQTVEIFQEKAWVGAVSCAILTATLLVFSLAAARSTGLGLGVTINIVLPWTLVVLLVKEYFSLEFEFIDFVDKVREREEERKRRRG